MSSTNLKRWRLDLQALRAIALVLVLLYHAWPGHVPGGFVGVDVFFVLSGFLITSHLRDEVLTRGQVQLKAFWLKRARRLLPAALLVLLVTVAATLLVVPPSSHQDFLTHVVASALYAENWALVVTSTDYLAGSAPPPTQHYWSLGVEEQFYLLWPLLAFIAAALAERGLKDPRRTLALVLALVTAASLVYAFLVVEPGAPQTYFSTPVRAWEFGLGALLAVVRLPRPWSLALGSRTGERFRAVLAWTGLFALAALSVTFDSETSFPSTNALLPVLATMLVVSAGEPYSRLSPTRLLAARPLQALGADSYSAYLWHWPVLTLLPHLLVRDLSDLELLLAVVLSLALARATRVLLEDPVRKSTFFSRGRPRRTLALVALPTALVLTIAGTSLVSLEHDVRAARAALEEVSGDPCFGPGAAFADGCADLFTPTQLDPAFVAADRSAGMDCLSDRERTADPCRHEVPGATSTVALVGDSHAASWLEGVEAVTDAKGFDLTTTVRAGCPLFATEALVSFGRDSAEDRRVCASWADALITDLAADARVSVVLTSARSDLYVLDDGSGGFRPVTTDDIRPALARLSAAGKRVVVLRDLPTTGGAGDLRSLELSREVLVPECLATKGAAACSGPRSERLVADPLADVARELSAQDPLVSVLDPTPGFCDAESCFVVAGGAPLYWDGSHLSASAARSLAPWLLEELEPVLVDALAS